jgi:type IV secretion system protein VirD4
MRRATEQPEMGFMELDRHHGPEQTNDRPLVAALILVLVLGATVTATRSAAHLPAASLPAPTLVLPGEWQIRLKALAVLFFGATVSLLATRRTSRFAAPLFVAGVACAIGAAGSIYSPLHLLRLHQLSAQDQKLADVLTRAWVLGAVLAVYGSWLTIVAWRHRWISAPASSYGSARWGAAMAFATPTGLLLGRDDRTEIRLDGEGHVLTVAPTRSGKGVSSVIPNLLDHPGSVLVTDPKGENYAVTARWRRAQGQVVHALDPFELVDGLAAYNPIDLVDTASPDAADDARMLADMLVLPEGKEGDQAFWNEEARGVLTGLILHVAAHAPPELRSLTHVRTLLTLAPEPFAALLSTMKESDAAGGLVARAATRLLQKADRERSGVISTAQSHTHFLDSPRMRRVLSCSTFDFADLKRDRISVFLILPSDRIDGYSRWLRLMIACGLLATTRTVGQPKDRILFLLDEFGHLRRMHPVQRDIGLAGGYGVRFWIILQDLSQLKSTYPDSWQTFLANAEVLQAFGTNDWDTAEYLSKMTGEATIQVRTENRSSGVSHGRHSQRQRGTGWSTAETGRRLLLPDEVRRLDRQRQLLFIKGTAPLLVERVNYIEDESLSRRADPNPLYVRVVG